MMVAHPALYFRASSSTLWDLVAQSSLGFVRITPASPKVLMGCAVYHHPNTARIHPRLIKTKQELFRLLLAQVYCPDFIEFSL